MRRVGSELRGALQARGVNLPPSVRADLGMTGQSVETFLAQCLLGAFLGLFLPFLVLGPMALVGDQPRRTAVAHRLRRRARRADALQPDPPPCGGPAARLPARGQLVPRPGGDEPGRRPRRPRGAADRDLGQRRLGDGADPGHPRGGPAPGHHPWTALGALGDELDIDELRDLAAALALVAEDGAKVRDSLAARARLHAPQGARRRGGEGGREVPVHAGCAASPVCRLSPVPDVPCCCKSPRGVTEDECGDHHRVATERLFVACRT